MTYPKIVKVEKGYIRKINREVIVPRALINYSSCGCLASHDVGNCDRLAIVWVAVRFRTYQAIGKGNYLLSITISSKPVYSLTSSIVSDVAFAGLI